MISGYFSKRQAEMKMPAGPDALGIRWQGAVMEGRMSVEQRFVQEKREIAGWQLNNDVSAGSERVYVREHPPLVGGRIPGRRD